MAPRRSARSLAGNGQHALQDGVGAVVVLCPDLNAPTSAQSPGDPGEPLGAAGHLDVQTEVRQVDRQPRILRQVAYLTGQPQIVSGDTLGDRDVIDLLAELIDAGAHPPSRAASGPTRRRLRRSSRTRIEKPTARPDARRGKDPRRSLKPDARGQPKKDRAGNGHHRMVAPPA